MPAEPPIYDDDDEEYDDDEVFDDEPMDPSNPLAGLVGLLDTVRQSKEGEDQHISFHYDGEKIIGADGKPERRLIQALRLMIQKVVAGEDPGPLEDKVDDLFERVDKAIKVSKGMVASENAAMKAYYEETVAGYEASLRALNRMDAALLEDPVECSILEDGFVEFRSAVLTIDALLEKQARGRKRGS